MTVTTVTIAASLGGAATVRRVIVAGHVIGTVCGDDAAGWDAYPVGAARPVGHADTITGAARLVVASGSVAA